LALSKVYLVMSHCPDLVHIIMRHTKQATLWALPIHLVQFSNVEVKSRRTTQIGVYSKHQRSGL